MSTNINGHFDEGSGVRERLALLAERGPEMTPAAWGYNPSRDVWYYCGSDPKIGRVRVEVRQEGSASLDIIATKHGMDRKTAMAFIGYPEKD